MATKPSIPCPHDHCLYVDKEKDKGALRVFFESRWFTIIALIFSAGMIMQQVKQSNAAIPVHETRLVALEKQSERQTELVRECLTLIDKINVDYQQHKISDAENSVLIQQNQKEIERLRRSEIR